jgi:hypothetical protein
MAVVSRAVVSFSVASSSLSHHHDWENAASLQSPLELAGCRPVICTAASMQWVIIRAAELMLFKLGFG